VSIVARIFLVFILAALLAPAALAAPPHLTAGGTAPFTVRGSHFKPGERVRIVVQAEDGGTKTVTAGALGGFVARFPGVSIGSCAAYVVRAFGSAGSRATLRVMPECPQPPTP